MRLNHVFQLFLQTCSQTVYMATLTTPFTSYKKLYIWGVLKVFKTSMCPPLIAHSPVFSTPRTGVDYLYRLTPSLAPNTKYLF